MPGWLPPTAPATPNPGEIPLANSFQALAQVTFKGDTLRPQSITGATNGVAVDTAAGNEQPQAWQLASPVADTGGGFEPKPGGVKDWGLDGYGPLKWQRKGSPFPGGKR